MDDYDSEDEDSMYGDESNRSYEAGRAINDGDSEEGDRD